MSCFWRGLTQSLPKERVKVLLNVQKVNDIRAVVGALKQQSVKTVNVKWNGEPLTQKQLDENLEHIND